MIDLPGFGQEEETFIDLGTITMRSVTPDRLDDQMSFPKIDIYTHDEEDRTELIRKDSDFVDLRFSNMVFCSVGPHIIRKGQSETIMIEPRIMTDHCHKLVVDLIGHDFALDDLAIDHLRFQKNQIWFDLWNPNDYDILVDLSSHSVVLRLSLQTKNIKVSFEGESE